MRGLWRAGGAVLFVLVACGTSSGGASSPDASTDGGTGPDATAGDTGGSVDAAGGDSSVPADAIGDSPSTEAADAEGDAAKDAASWCTAPDAGGPPLGPNLCSSTGNCYVAGLACQPVLCEFGNCTQQFLTPNAPDGTPCDDDKGASTAVYPCGDGDPSHVCPAGACAGGPTPGAACSSNADCTGGATNAPCTRCGFAGQPYCRGGSERGTVCRTSIGACGTTAPSTDCPPDGRCVLWTCDTASRYCVATGDNPGKCTTAADCPTTKYCFGDAENSNATAGTGWVGCFANDVPGSCSNGGPADMGPCFQWSCVNGQCVSPVPCRGGARGAGSVCNDVCLGGSCTAAYAVCP
jgi:hypothetical protein